MGGDQGGGGGCTEQAHGAAAGEGAEAGGLGQEGWGRQKWARAGSRLQTEVWRSPGSEQESFTCMAGVSLGSAGGGAAWWLMGVYGPGPRARSASVIVVAAVPVLLIGCG